MAMEGRVAGDVPVESGTQELMFSVSVTMFLTAVVGAKLASRRPA